MTVTTPTGYALACALSAWGAGQRFVPWLAWQRATPPKANEIVPWVIGIGVVAVAVGLVGLALYRRYHAQLQDEPVLPPFTLAELRQLHHRGQISDEEYERCKAKLIDAVTAEVDAIATVAESVEEEWVEIELPPADDAPPARGDNGDAKERDNGGDSPEPDGPNDADDGFSDADGSHNDRPNP
jgi:Short C-terminal domain